MFTNDDAIALYTEKEEYLAQYFDRVAPLDFYRDIFPVGEFETAGIYSDAKPNGIALYFEDGSPRRRLVFDDLGALSELMDTEAVIAPVSFFGKRRVSSNARFAYALTIDLDGVGMPQLRDFIHQSTTIEYLPRPTYLVNSGNGLHLYYVFEQPVPLYPEAFQTLSKLKRFIIDVVWNTYTSRIEKRQYQGITQGYRLVGSPTKLGPDYRTTAYWFGPKTSPEKLIEFLEEKRKEIDLSTLTEKSTLTLAQAKNKYPEWYHKRIELQEPRGHWTANKALYEWWKYMLQTEVKTGHRYHSIVALAAFAQKCGIDYETLESDAYSMVDRLDLLTKEEDNHFTSKDVEAALRIYDDEKASGKTAADFSREYLSRITGVNFPPPNKRNGASQKDHLEIARATKTIKKKQGRLKKKEGRPSSYQIVFDYLSQNPDARKIDVEKATGLAHSTVNNHYDAIKNEKRVSP